METILTLLKRFYSWVTEILEGVFDGLWSYILSKISAFIPPEWDTDISIIYPYIKTLNDWVPVYEILNILTVMIGLWAVTFSLKGLVKLVRG